MRGSLWLLPEAAAAGEFEAVIAHLAGDASGFAPHVTLLGRLECDEDQALRRTETLAQQLAPIRVRPQPPRSYPEHFRRWVLDLPAAELQAAHRLACAVFAARSPPFAPHLSLYYGDAAPAAKVSPALAPFTLDRLAFTTACAETPVADWRVYTPHRLGV